MITFVPFVLNISGGIRLKNKEAFVQYMAPVTISTTEIEYQCSEESRSFMIIHLFYDILRLSD